MASEKLQVILELITGNYKKEAREAAGATGQIGAAAATSTRGLGGLGTAMGAMKGALLAGGVAAAGAALINLGRASVKAASDLGESVNAVGVVFEESQDRILEWGKTAAETAGLSSRAFHESVIPIGALLKNFGFDVDESADAVIALTQRAADLGSTLNIDTSVALDKFRAGLAGEAEPLKAFGVDVSVAAIKQEALRLGLIQSGEALDANARAQAAMSIIMQSTDDYAGDFANTLGTSLPNQTKKLNAQIENLQARLGEKLLPSVLTVTEALGDMTEEGGFLETVLIGLAGELGDTANQAAGVFGLLDKITKQLADSAGATDEATEAASRYNSLWDILIPGLGAAGGQLQDLNEWLERTKTVTKDTGITTDAMTSSYERAEAAILNSTAALEENVAALAAADDAELSMLRAEENVTEARRNLIAVTDDATASTDEKRIAQLEYNIAVATARVLTDEYKASVEALNGTRADVTVVTRMQQFLRHDEIEEIKAGGGPPRPTGITSGRAWGGPVTAGQSYMVGERGPEMFVPDQSGMIIPGQNGMMISAVASTHITEGATIILQTPMQNFAQDLQLATILATVNTMVEVQ